MPPCANRRANSASAAGGRPCGLSAEQVSARAQRHPPARLVQPMARTAEHPHQLGRQIDVVEHHVLVQRRVAEQHVELPGIRSDGLGGERDADLEQRVVCRIASTRPTISERTKSSSIAATGISTLCSTAIARALLDRARVAADVIDGLQTGMHGPRLWPGNGLAYGR